MTQTQTPLTVALLAIPETTASTLYGMHDLFASAGRDWDFLVTGVPGPSRIRSLIVASQADGFAAANGVWVRPDTTLADCPPTDVVCIPEVYVPPDEDVAERYGQELAWLRACAEGGTTLAAACSGAVMLAAAGLLDGQDATTHWGYCDALSRRYPAIRMHPERALVVSGPGQRLVMAGGGTTWMDLALYLVARFVGVDEAMRLARIYLVDWHASGQQPYASLVRARQTADATIGECQAWIAGHYEMESPVAAMARRSGLPLRSFTRRFRKATGLSPMEYIHTLRLEEAKQLLESTDDPIDAVAREVGYDDGSFFGRLFRRKVGLTPARYRRQFRGMRMALEAMDS